jgi:hypothetical protein
MSEPTCYNGPVVYEDPPVPPLVKCEDCDGVFWTLEDFRARPLEQMLTVEVDERLEVRRCECGCELALWVDRNGTPVAPGHEGPS